MRFLWYSTATCRGSSVVERSPEEAGVGGSIPSRGTRSAWLTLTICGRGGTWQTHYLEVVALARAWRFESSRPHQKHDGRLAQLVERLIDVEKVIGSNPIPPTQTKTPHLRGFGLRIYSVTSLAAFFFLLTAVITFGTSVRSFFLISLVVLSRR